MQSEMSNLSVHDICTQVETYSQHMPLFTQSLYLAASLSTCSRVVSFVKPQICHGFSLPFLMLL